MQRVPLFISASLVLAIQAAAAQEPEDLITVSGLRPTAPEDVTATVSVLSAEDLAIRNSVYIADQLRAIPGIGVSRSGASGGLTQVRVRGAEANHTLVLINGIEIADPVTGETDFGLWGGIDTSRIEVLRGEQSALYGSDAIGGVINIITDDRSGTSALFEGGSDSTFRFSGRHGGGTEDKSYSMSIAGFTTEGVDTSGTTGEEDGSETLLAMVTGRTPLGDLWDLNGLFRYTEDSVETDADTDFDGLLDDSIRETDSRQLLLGGVLQGETGPVDHLLRASFSEVIRENMSDGTFSDETRGERLQLGYSPSRTFAVEQGSVTVSGLIGYEKEDYERISTVIIFGNPNQKQTFETTGIAGEVIASLNRLTLNGSVRHDDNDGRFEDATTWRLGAAMEVTDNLRLRASAGTGVKNPTFTELFGFFPSNFTGNPDLKPEKSESYEAGIDYSHGPLALSATWFSAELEDEIFTVFNPNLSSSAANRAGNSDRDGIELAAQWTISDSLSFSGSFSDISSEDDTGAQEIRVPEQTASLAVNWQSPVTDGFQIGAALDYVGEQDDFFFTFPAERVTLDSYTLASFTVVYPLTERLSLTLRGQNIFDEDVTDVFGFEQPGAQFFAGIRLR